MRPGNCYLELRDDTRGHDIICERALASNVTMKQCCCSVGLGWNAVEDERRRRPCVACPRYGSSTNRRLTSGGARKIRVQGVVNCIPLFSDGQKQHCVRHSTFEYPCDVIHPDFFHQFITVVFGRKLGLHPVIAES